MLKWRALALGLPLASLVAGISGVISPGTAAASSSTAPLAGGNYAKSLILNDTGAQLKSWNQTSVLCPENPGYVANGTLTAGSGGTLKLTTTSEPGSCVALVSPGAYSSGVIEADIDFPALPGKPSAIANWTGFWLTNGPAWPTAGELDAVEVEPADGRNAVTWHSGTASSLFSASTSGYFPIKLPTETADLTPGWHTVDIVYAKGFFAVYYDGRKYTSYTNGNVTGSPLNIYFTMTDTPDNSYVEQRIGRAPINSDTSPATLAVKYLRVWSYR